MGSFGCTCKEGFTGDGTICTGMYQYIACVGCKQSSAGSKLRFHVEFQNRVDIASITRFVHDRDGYRKSLMGCSVERNFVYITDVKIDFHRN